MPGPTSEVPAGASAALETPAATDKLKIDVVVHGRFHAFHLARALLARGHDVRLLTNYPAWAVERFGIAKANVRSCTLHGLASRLHDRTLGRLNVATGQPSLHKAFGRWAAGAIRPDADLVYIFSGIAEEALRGLRSAVPRSKLWLVRGSSHIRTQYTLLHEEEIRVGTPIDKPSAWSMAREEREYAMASHIVTLSKFSHATFRARPALADKAVLLVSAVDASRFRPDPTIAAERCRRIRQGGPLRVLNVGAFSYRKGAHDLAEAAARLAGRMQFRFVGDLPGETSALQRRVAGVIDLQPRVPEFELVQHYAWADIFVFPTIEDGFPAVVAQAQASGLVVITTPNGSGPDLITEAATGWILPIRNSALLIEKLQFCDDNRGTLADMTAQTYDSYAPRDWAAMAQELERHYAGTSTI